MAGDVCAQHQTTLNDYQTIAANITRPQELVHSVLALAEEAGEVVAVLRRAMYREMQGNEIVDRLEDELGDVLWCVAAVAADAGLSLEAIAQRNLAKLKERHDPKTMP